MRIVHVYRSALSCDVTDVLYSTALPVTDVHQQLKA